MGVRYGDRKDVSRPARFLSLSRATSSPTSVSWPEGGGEGRHTAQSLAALDRVVRQLQLRRLL